MTLPLRRKHQITAPNTSRATAISRLARGFGWQSAAAVLALGAGMLFANLARGDDYGPSHWGDGRLAWRPERTTVPYQEAPAAVKRSSSIPQHIFDEPGQSSEMSPRPCQSVLRPTDDGRRTAFDEQRVVRTSDSEAASDGPSLSPSDPFGDRPRRARPQVQQAHGEGVPHEAVRVTRPIDGDLQLKGLEEEVELVAPRQALPIKQQPPRVGLPDSPEEPAMPRRELQPREAMPLEPSRDDRGDERERGRNKGDLCVSSRKECSKEFQKLQEHTLDKVDLDISVQASLREMKVPEAATMGRNYPCECTLGNDVFVPRHWCCTTFTWKASALCHKPLYFEDVEMERYGHSWGPVLDPFVSAKHFLDSIVFLPYHKGMELPNECVYALGYYRPGDCAPYCINSVPWSGRGALFEIAEIAGIVFAVP